VALRVVYFGSGEIGLPSLRAVEGDASLDLVAVVTQPDRPAGREMRVRASAVKVFAEARGVEVFQPGRVREPAVVERLAAWGADVFLVAAYGQILPRAVLDLPRLGCFNIHASLLPRHRGASCIQAAILAGDRETGITLIRMDEGLDTGAIVARRAVRIGRHETAGELHDRLGEVAGGMMGAFFAALASGSVVAQVQDDALATYAPKLARADGRVVWVDSARAIQTRFRAFYPWPGAFACFSHRGREMTLKVHGLLVAPGGGDPGRVVRVSRWGLHVGTGAGQVVLTSVQPSGGRRMSGVEFARGYAVGRLD
jgi:methionyl-tRNA formyltransferase